MHSSYLKVLSKVILALLFYVFIIIRYFFKKVFNIIENLFQDVVSITLAKFSIITHQSHISQVPSLTESLTYITSRASCDAKNHLVFGFIFIKLFAVFGILLQFIQLSWSSGVRQCNFRQVRAAIMMSELWYFAFPTCTESMSKLLGLKIEVKACSPLQLPLPLPFVTL